MVKVIRAGKPQDLPIRVDCRKCEAELEFKPSEPEVRRNYDIRDGDYYSLECPCCGSQVTQQCVLRLER